jgi:hypothetical protein
VGIREAPQASIAHVIFTVNLSASSAADDAKANEVQNKANEVCVFPPAHILRRPAYCIDRS